MAPDETQLKSVNERLWLYNALTVQVRISTAAFVGSPWAGRYWEQPHR